MNDSVESWHFLWRFDIQDCHHYRKRLTEPYVLGLCQYEIKGGTSIELSLTHDIMGIWMKVFPPPKLQTRLNPHCFIGLSFFLVCIFYGSAIQDGHQA